MKWYKEEFIFSLQIGVGIAVWFSWMDWMLSDYDVEFFDLYMDFVTNLWLYVSIGLISIFLIKLFSKKYRNTNIVNHISKIKFQKQKGN